MFGVRVLGSSVAMNGAMTTARGLGLWVCMWVLGGCVGAVDGVPGTGGGDGQSTVDDVGDTGADGSAQPMPDGASPEPSPDGGTDLPDAMASMPDAGGGMDDAGTDPTPVGWPDATNTGVVAGTALTASGSITASQASQVIENKDITGSITVKASNVTIRNCRIRSGGTAITLQDGANGMVVEDVTIIGTNTDSSFENPAIAIGTGTGATVYLRRINLSKYRLGIRLFGGRTTIVDSYLHEMYVTEGNGNKRGRDAIEGWAGSHVVIRHNTVEVGADEANCAVKFPCDLPWSGRGDDIVIDGNLLAGAGWTVCAGMDCPGDPPDHKWTNVHVTNNHFSTKFYPKCGYYGPIGYADWNLVTGNVWHESGNAL